MFVMLCSERSIIEIVPVCYHKSFENTVGSVANDRFLEISYPREFATKRAQLQHHDIINNSKTLNSAMNYF